MHVPAQESGKLRLLSREAEEGPVGSGLPGGCYGGAMHARRFRCPAWGLLPLRVLAFLAVCALVGCVASSTDGESCGGSADALSDFVEANKACERDADCVVVYEECLPRDHQEGCCAVSLRADYDPIVLEALAERVEMCGTGPGRDGDCGNCCLQLTMGSACTAGRCVAGGEGRP